QTWMREELGMFKFEQALTLKAFHVETLLAKRREFQKRGERRQKALITNEAFPLALRFARADFYLSAEDLLYWQERRAQLEGDIPSPQARRRRRRPRGQRPRSGEVRPS